MSEHASTPPLHREIKIPRADDLHIHLRQGDLMQAVVPLVYEGGVGRCLVMPNTAPPISTTLEALRYRDDLLRIDARLDYLMTLYLGPRVTASEIEKAADSGITGVKCYPRGVTTHSENGTEDLQAYAETFAAMEASNLVLELHGETPSDPEQDICVLNAEQHFLDTLRRLHDDYPGLRIVLEHVTTAEAVACVKELGENVAATVTAHHLDLTVDDWAGRNHAYCKPVAKYPHDRAALREVLREGDPSFFLGSDSAPHPRSAKEGACGCAGVFTSPLLLAYLADSFDRIGCLDRLSDFVGGFGHRFYGLPAPAEQVTLVRQEQKVPSCCGAVVPYRFEETLHWRIES